MSAAARAFATQSGARVHVVAANRSASYAALWLRRLGAVETTVGEPDPGADVTVLGCGGDAPAPPTGSCVVRLWDFQVGRPGSGHLASAVSGAAAVIGEQRGPPVALPADMPEKWCGAYGAILALAELWRRARGGAAPSVAYDVAAADVLRAFSLQNAGDRVEMAKSWRRNGRLAVEHGGIYPQGFYACRDGHVALLGRSRRDWQNILRAVGSPAWSAAPAYADPFSLARDSERADALLQETLSAFGRDDLLRRGLREEAVIAPVYTLAEAATRGVFREDFMSADGSGMPMRIEPLPAPGGERRPDEPRDAPARGDAPLAGMRCIELAWVWSGPLVGQILADLGAEVIKVEWRTRFDLYRTRGVETLRGVLPEEVRRESSLYFHSLNRNKLGLSLDLKRPEGAAALRKLAARSDLLVENFTAGTLERLGLGPAELAAANGGIVALSMSGPGRGSAVEALRSYGLVLSALGGAEALIKQDERFVGSPTFSLSDPNAALFGAMAALAGALSARDGGRGMAIDLSQIEAAATLAGVEAVREGGEFQRAILQGTDGRFVAIEWREGPREFGSASATELAERCRAAGGRAELVLELGETDGASVFADADAWLPASHPTTGEELLVAAPWRVDGRRPPLRKTAPLLGESNDRVLRRILGLANDEIAALQASGAL